MAGFICTAENKSYFVGGEAYGFMAARKIAGHFPEGTNIIAKPIKRFITIYGEYIDLEGGNINDKRPIQITELVNGRMVSHAREFGLSDHRKLYLTEE